MLLWDHGQQWRHTGICVSGPPYDAACSSTVTTVLFPPCCLHLVNHTTAGMATVCCANNTCITIANCSSFACAAAVACRYTTFAIGVTAEVVALLLVGSTVDRIGRHNVLAFGQLLGGGACLACAMVSGSTSQTVLAGIGKLGSSGQCFETTTPPPTTPPPPVCWARFDSHALQRLPCAALGRSH